MFTWSWPHASRCDHQLKLRRQRVNLHQAIDPEATGYSQQGRSILQTSVRTLFGLPDTGWAVRTSAAMVPTTSGTITTYRNRGARETQTREE